MSKILHHLAARIVNTPLMIRPSKLDAILCGPDKLGERFGLDISGQAGVELQAARPRENVNISTSTIAVIPVLGILVHRAGQIAPNSSALRSYEGIRAEFREALRSPDVDMIVFDIDSPGGEVAGALDLADQIYHARFQKPIFAIVNESACSAAYLLACAAEKIYIPRTGDAGSIGVIAIHTDQSGYDEKLGVKYTHIFAGKHKADFSPHDKLSEAARTIAQGEVDNIYNLFLETVARNRGIDVESVRKTEAGVFLGAEAVKLGLADEVMSFDDALADIAAGNKKGEGMKTTKEKLALAMEGASPEEITPAMAELGYVSQAAAQATQEEPVDIEAVKAAAKKDALTYVGEVMELCALAQMPQLAAGFIAKETAKEEISKALLTAKADLAGQHEIISTVNPTNTGEVNPLLADANKRAQAAKSEKANRA